MARSWEQAQVRGSFCSQEPGEKRENIFEFWNQLLQK